MSRGQSHSPREQVVEVFGFLEDMNIIRFLLWQFEAQQRAMQDGFLHPVVEKWIGIDFTAAYALELK